MYGLTNDNVIFWNFQNPYRTNRAFSGDAELKLTDIPYIIELRFTSLTFFDSIRLCVISGTEARKLIDRWKKF